MQGSNSDSFIKTNKQQKRFDDGTGKRRDPKKNRGNYHKEMRQRGQNN